MKDSKTQLTKKLKDHLKDKVEFALIFGSIVYDRFTDRSDVDVGIYLNENPGESQGTDLSAIERLNFAADLSAIVGREVDIVFLNDSDPIITMQVLANGELIVDNNRELYIQFKARSLSLYADFKLSRRIIEDNLVKK